MTDTNPSNRSPAQSIDGSGEAEDWIGKVAAVIPGEVTAVYLAIRSTVLMLSGSDEQLGSYVPYVLFISIVLLVPVTPLFMKIIRGASFRVGCIIAASFFIWALNIDYDTMVVLAERTDETLFNFDDESDNSGPITIFTTFFIPTVLIAWSGLFIPILIKATGGAVSRTNGG